VILVQRANGPGVSADRFVAYLMSAETDMRRIEVVDEPIAKILLTKTPGERMDMGFGAAAFAKMTIESNVRQFNPAWDDARVKAEGLRRMNS